MNPIEEFIELLQVKDEKVISKIRELGEIRRYKKGDIILSEGEYPEFVPFLLSGIARGFSTDYHGKEFTNCLVTRRMESLFPSTAIDAKAVKSMEALTDLEVLCFPAKESYNVIVGSHSLLLCYLVFLQAALAFQYELKNMLCTLTAMERYKWFLQTYPGLDKKISDKYIASYLNMTPVSISRLRSALREEQSE